MKALIDADNLAFACAASSEDQDHSGIACARASTMLNVIMEESGATEHQLWLSGPDNFRKDIYPEYKGNRVNAYVPRWYLAVKEYLTVEHGAMWSEGCESDDMLGIGLTEDPTAIACHLDKDINMIPGWHYNWELRRLGKVIRESKKYYVTPEEAIRFFYYQCLVGDSVDNVKGVVGCGPKTAEKLLSQCSSEEEYYQTVREQYSCDEEFEMNAQVLWIWRKPGDVWQLKDGLKDELKASS